MKERKKQERVHRYSLHPLPLFSLSLLSSPLSSSLLISLLSSSLSSPLSQLHIVNLDSNVAAAKEDQKIATTLTLPFPAHLALGEGRREREREGGRREK